MGRFTLNAKQIAIALTVIGGAFVTAGIAMIFPTAAFIAAGCALVYLGLFAEFDAK